MPEIILSTAQPSLFVSDRFIDTAHTHGLHTAAPYPYHISEVTRIARHGTLPTLGGLMLHGPKEGGGGKKTVYYQLPRYTGSLAGVGQSISKADIAAAAEKEELTVLSLNGTELTEEDLSLEFYRSARDWRDPNARSLRPDAWLGFVGGGTLGLAAQVIRVGLEEAPADLAGHAKAFIIGAAVGGLAKPFIAAARLHYDRPTIKKHRPIILD